MTAVNDAPPVDECLRRLRAARQRHRDLDDKRVVHRHRGAAERGDVAAIPVLDCGRIEWTADECDPPVSQSDEIGSRLARGQGVVHGHLRDVQLIATDGRDRNAFASQALDRLEDPQRLGGVADLTADQDDACGLLAQHHREVALQLGGVAVVVADKDDQAFGDGLVLQSADPPLKYGSVMSWTMAPTARCAR